MKLIVEFKGFEKNTAKTMLNSIKKSLESTLDKIVKHPSVRKNITVRIETEE